MGDTRPALQSLPSFPQQLVNCPLWDEWMDEVLFPWHRLFSAPHPFGLTVTLGQLSPMVSSLPCGWGRRGVSEDHMVSALPSPSYVHPCTGPALRGTRRASQEGSARHGPSHAHPIRNQLRRQRCPLGTQRPRAPHGPPGRPALAGLHVHLPSSLVVETASTGRTK